jgi:hypothetical protein
MRCVLARDFTVEKAARWRGAIYDNPPYQREGLVWSLEKQQRFIDSLLNGFDVPKIYLHDLRGQHPTRVYAVIDGKQRLNTIWRFLDDELPLADDFRTEPNNVPEVAAGAVPPGPGQRFSQLAPVWRRILSRTTLAVVLVQNAIEEDIEDLFSRLNSGEPLNAAEKRNAMGGDMAELVRAVARHPFIVERLGWSNDRYRHLELAARILMLEQADREGAAVPDLGSRDLDAFVASNRRLPMDDRADLLTRVHAGLVRLHATFVEHDRLLAGQPPLLVYHLFVRELARRAGAGAAADGAPAAWRAYLEAFQHARLGEGPKRGGTRDAMLSEFTELGTDRPHDGPSLQRRLEILLGGFSSSGGVRR